MVKEKSLAAHKILTVLGAIFCISLIPILIINLTLIMKSYTNEDAVPDIGGYFPLIVLTDSMYPEIKSGDLIICHTAEAEEIKENDVISFFDPAGSGTSVVTHRVIEIVSENGGLFFCTKGDNNNDEDKDPVPAEKLVGVYRTRIAGAGNIAMFMQSTAGLILCVILPVILLISYDMIRRRLYEKSRQSDTDALLEELARLRAQKEKAEANQTNTIVSHDDEV